MADEIPRWAGARASELFDAEDMAGWVGEQWRNSFARYIAAHEEPPVDPLLIEARKFMGNYRGPPLDMEKASADYAAGVHDESNEMRFLRAALRRGIQLASDATASVQSPGCVDAAPGRKG